LFPAKAIAGQEVAQEMHIDTQHKVSAVGQDMASAVGLEHSYSSYVTDYLIFATGLCCFFWTSAKFAWGAGKTMGTLSVFLLMQSLAFGFGGAAHHMLDIYTRTGEAAGQSWSQARSLWMYFWFGSVLFSCMGSAATMALTFAFSAWPVWTLVFAYIAGAGVAAYEALVLGFWQSFLNGDSVCSSASLVFILFSTVVLAGGVVQKGASNGQALHLFGTIVALIGWMLFTFVPKSSFPTSLNRTSTFHLFIHMSMIFVSMAVWQQAASSLWRQFACGADLKDRGNHKRAALTSRT